MKLNTPTIIASALAVTTPMMNACTPDTPGSKHVAANGEDRRLAGRIIPNSANTTGYSKHITIHLQNYADPEHPSIELFIPTTVLSQEEILKLEKNPDAYISAELSDYAVTDYMDVKKGEFVSVNEVKKIRVLSSERDAEALAKGYHADAQAERTQSQTKEGTINYLEAAKAYAEKDSTLAARNKELKAARDSIGMYQKKLADQDAKEDGRERF